MRCPICRAGETAPGLRAVTLHVGDAVVVIRDVPGEVCDACGEGYSTPEVTARYRAIARAAAAGGVEVSLCRYVEADAERLDKVHAG